jgi:hypothetical protein
LNNRQDDSANPQLDTAATQGENWFFLGDTSCVSSAQILLNLDSNRLRDDLWWRQRRLWVIFLRGFGRRIGVCGWHGLGGSGRRRRYFRLNRDRDRDRVGNGHMSRSRSRRGDIVSGFRCHGNRHGSWSCGSGGTCQIHGRVLCIGRVRRCSGALRTVHNVIVRWNRVNRSLRSLLNPSDLNGHCWICWVAHLSWVHCCVHVRGGAGRGHVVIGFISRGWDSVWNGSNNGSSMGSSSM